jgi:DNA uptake protein ComE-like DNA-binding protein
MQNVDRTHPSPDRQPRHKHSGPTDEGQGQPTGETQADTQSIDLNHSTWQQLMGVEGMEEAQAHAIVEHRTRLGHFQTWEDLERVAGVDAELVHNLQHAARIGGLETAQGKPRPPHDVEQRKQP